MRLDVLASVQTEPANMDPEKLKAAFGDKLTYCGMIDTLLTYLYQQTEPNGGWVIEWFLATIPP